MGSIAYSLEAKGIPTVGLVFQEQEGNYKAQAGLAGYGEVPTLVYPADSILTPEGAHEVGRAAAPAVIRALTDGKPLYMTVEGDRWVPSPQQMTFTGATYDEAYQAFEEMFRERGWSDGLPLVPPTPEKVAWLLTGTDKSPDEVIGRMGPSLGEVTVKVIAIDAAMAGARPEYMPVIIAAMKAITSYPYDSYGPQLRGVAPLVIVNGPIADEIGINHRNNDMGPNSRYPARATIGRAINLIIRNAGGWGYGLVLAAQHGQPGEYTGLVIAESEHTGTWEPLNVQLDFPRGSNTVTVLGVMGSMNIPGKTLEHAGAAIPPTTAAWSGDRAAWQRRIAGVYLITPMRAVDLSSQGVTKADIAGSVPPADGSGAGAAHRSGGLAAAEHAGGRAHPAGCLAGEVLGRGLRRLVQLRSERLAQHGPVDELPGDGRDREACQLGPAAGEPLAAGQRCLRWGPVAPATGPLASSTSEAAALAQARFTEREPSTANKAANAASTTS